MGWQSSANQGASSTSLTTVSSPSCPTTAPPRTMSSSLTVKLVTRSTSSSPRTARTPVSHSDVLDSGPLLTCFRRHCSHCYGRGGCHRRQGGSQGLDLLRWIRRLSAGIAELGRTPVKSLAEQVVHLSHARRDGCLFGNTSTCMRSTCVDSGQCKWVLRIDLGFCIAIYGKRFTI